MNQMDDNFKTLATHILNNGVKKRNRTDIDTLSVFGYQMRFEVGNYFPLLSLRKIHTKSVIHELLWILGSYDEEYEKFGRTSIRYLLDNNVTFWTEWVFKDYNEKRKYRPELKELTMKEFEKKIMNDDDFAIEFSSLGPVYGHQWTNWNGRIIDEVVKQGFDMVKDEETDMEFKVPKPDKIRRTKVEGINQVDIVIEQLKKDPDSRRIIIETWNVEQLDKMLLHPCHKTIQFYTYQMNPKERYYEFTKWCKKRDIECEGMTLEDATRRFNFPTRKVSLQLYQRSGDTFLGIPYNVTEYTILLHMIAQVVNMIPNEFIWTGGDVHLYENSIEATKELLNRNTKSQPRLIINPNIKNIYDFRFEDIKIDGYDAHPNIKVDVAV